MGVRKDRGRRKDALREIRSWGENQHKRAAGASLWHGLTCISHLHLLHPELCGRSSATLWWPWRSRLLSVWLSWWTTLMCPTSWGILQINIPSITFELGRCSWDPIRVCIPSSFPPPPWHLFPSYYCVARASNTNRGSQWVRVKQLIVSVLGFSLDEKCKVLFTMALEN